MKVENDVFVKALLHEAIFLATQWHFKLPSATFVVCKITFCRSHNNLRISKILQEPALSFSLKFTLQVARKDCLKAQVVYFCVQLYLGKGLLKAVK